MIGNSGILLFFLLLGAEAGLVITNPNQNSLWTGGDLVKIEWNTDVFALSNITVELWKDSLLLPNEKILDITDSAMPSVFPITQGFYSWVVPKTLIPATDYYIFLYYTNDPTLYAESTDFTIQQETNVSSGATIPPSNSTGGNWPIPSPGLITEVLQILCQLESLAGRLPSQACYRDCESCTKNDGVWCLLGEMEFSGSVEYLFNGPENAVGNLCWTGHFYHFTGEETDLGLGVTLTVSCGDPLEMPQTQCSIPEYEEVIGPITGLGIVGAILASCWGPHMIVKRWRMKKTKQREEEGITEPIIATKYNYYW